MGTSAVDLFAVLAAKPRQVPPAGLEGRIAPRSSQARSPSLGREPRFQWGCHSHL